MGFTFGASTPAPAAPAAPAAAAPAGGFSFGGTPAAAPGAPAPAPAGGGFSFGGTPAAATGAPAPAGAAPAPAAGGFSFGGGTKSSAAAAPSAAGLLFGATPASAPAPAGGGLFGNTPAAPAPAGGGLFGSTPAAPAAPGGGLFGSTPAAPAAGFGATAPAVAPLGGGISGSVLSGQTPYTSLPPQAKQALDAIYQKIMTHRRTMMQVETMAPALLRQDDNSRDERNSPSSPADAAAGIGAGDDGTLLAQLATLKWKVQEYIQTLETYRAEALALRKKCETSTTQAVMYGVWPIEALAARRGVKLKSSDEKNNANKADPQVQNELKDLLDKQAATVDRVERMPSPYMWQAIQDMESRLSSLLDGVNSLQYQLAQSEKALKEGRGAPDIAKVVQLQTQSLFRVAESVASFHGRVEQLRIKYRQYERGEDVLQKAEAEEAQRQLRLEQQMRLQYVVAAPTAAAPAVPGAPGAAPVPSTGGGIFGNTAAAPAPPAGGGLFGSTPAAPAAGGGLFGSTPAAPAAGGGLFGSTPAAPAAGGGLFGSKAPAPAPSAGGGLFGSTPAAPAAPATGGGFSFGGAAPAPAGAAPAAGGLFGAATPAAPAPAAPGAAPFSFGNNAAAPAKPKGKSRGGRRR